VIADQYQRAVIGSQRITRFKFGNAIVTDGLPVAAAGQHFALHLWAGDFSPGNGHEAPRALADMADIKRGIDPDIRRENKFERRRWWYVGQGRPP